MERKRSVRRQRRYERPFAKKCKDLCRQFIAFLFSNVGIIGLVVSYTIAGAFIFRFVEKKYQMQVRLDVLRIRNETVSKFWNKTLEMNTFAEADYKKLLLEELLIYQKRMVKFIQRGYDGENYSDKWSFAGAFLYSLTVITTIGYGNISPHTIEGKITTIVYAIIGMPLFLLYLSNIGDIMARSFKWVYANCCLCRWCPGVAKRRAERKRERARLEEGEEEEEEEYEVGMYQNYGDFYKQRPSIVSDVSQGVTEGGSEESYDVQTVTVPVTICLMIMVGYICGGALLFCKWEDWEFMDAFYFCFISLSTIGFGDLVPGDKIYRRGDDEFLVDEVLELTFVICAMYLMVGMALIAMCFNLMQEEVIHKIRTTLKLTPGPIQSRRERPPRDGNPVRPQTDFQDPTKRKLLEIHVLLCSYCQ
ncbi:TWiK family of potassium channels protein 7-like Protein [Tribolium castaneum]|uniref:TWiK family of potassium channels protein 7-like Protein n=1 Tax=Tribolium castaneum TaxID=7070 RepID=D6WYP0_TRICA|nr:TWiK family of potassium channels protein 7-like Protein [Tribolium castaneum]